MSLLDAREWLRTRDVVDDQPLHGTYREAIEGAVLVGGLALTQLALVWYAAKWAPGDLRRAPGLPRLGPGLHKVTMTAKNPGPRPASAHSKPRGKVKAR